MMKQHMLVDEKLRLLNNFCMYFLSIRKIVCVNRESLLLVLLDVC